MHIVENELATVEKATAHAVGDLLVLAPYEKVQAFRIGGQRDHVVVHHAGGELTVDVEPVTVDGEAPGPEDAATGRGLAPGRSGGLLIDPFGEPGEAYGYSRSYDLREAVEDAISKLPAGGAGIPDWLNTYSIVSLDVEIGGIAGFNHLRVTVRG